MKRLQLVLLFAIILGVGDAISQSWDFTSSDYQTSDFTSAGNAYWVDDSGLTPSKRMRLVPLFNAQQGSFWLNLKHLNPDSKWRVNFTADMNFGSNAIPADGFAFVIQPTGTDLNSSIYHGAYADSVLSVTVATWENNHFTVYANNNVPPRGTASIVGIKTFTDIDVSISYEPSNTTLSVSLVQAGGPSVAYDVIIDLASELGTSDDFTIGFSAQTGGFGTNHSIKNFLLERTLFVNPVATGLNNGTSWENAFLSLQSALDIATDGDAIWVGKGTYYPTSVHDLFDTDRHKHFRLTDGVKLYGGFSGSETTLAQRVNYGIDGENETILSGNIGDPSSNTDNSFCLLYLPDSLNLTENTLIDGLSFADAYATITTNDRKGAAIHSINNSLTINGCNFYNNLAGNFGAAIYQESGVFKMTNSHFSNNEGVKGVYCAMSAIASVDNCIFSSNESTYQCSGMYIANSTSRVSLNNSTFVNNTSANNYSAIVNEGVSTLTNSIIWNNTSGGGVPIANTNSFTISYCDIQDCGASGVNWVSSLGTDGGGNIEADPIFGGLAQEQGDVFALHADSPCRNAGNNSGLSSSYDYRGSTNARIQEGTVDMGAYEFTSGIDPLGYVILVDSSATGADDGSSWGDAFTSLQSALDVAEANDVIWVARGTYFPEVDEDGNINVDVRRHAFQLLNNVAIYGGFSGNETHVSQRSDFAMGGDNETILSAERASASASDNHYHIFYHPAGNAAVDATAVLDGFSITRGYQGSYPYYDGAGMCLDGSSPTVRNCSFTDNVSYYGGAVHIRGASPTFINCLFADNQSAYGGGAYILDVYNPIAESDPIFTNCTFTDNNGGAWGGAIENLGHTLTLNNCIIWGNDAVGAPEIYNANSKTVYMYNTCIKGGVSSLVNTIDGGGNISTDPKFMGYGDKPYLPYGISPCIDAGLNTANSQLTDISGQKRMLDKENGQSGTIDMGAYEFNRNVDVYTPPVYVDIEADGANTGLNWDDAYSSLQMAIDSADAGDTIWIASGVYVPEEDLTGNVSPAVEQTKSFYIKKDMVLIGGFESGQYVITERENFGEGEVNETILSGELQNDGDSLNNCYNLMRIASFNGSVIFDGLTFSSASANASSFPYNCGGVLYHSPSSSGTFNLDFNNCLFKDIVGSGSAGYTFMIRALFKSINTRFDNCVFKDLRTSDYATALHLTSQDSLKVEIAGCEFSNISGRVFDINAYEGCIDFDMQNSLVTNTSRVATIVSSELGSKVVSNFTNVSIVGNQYAFGYDGTIYEMQTSDGIVNTNITNCIFWDNRSSTGLLETTNYTGVNVSSAVFKNSIIEGSGGSDDWKYSITRCTATDGGNNLDTFPLFVDEAAGDYRLFGNSLGVNAGIDDSIDVVFDFRGVGFPRKVTTVDIGAYEYQPGTDPGLCDLGIEITQVQDTFKCNIEDAAYQWLSYSFGLYTPISDETKAYMIPSESGTYAVEVRKEGCTDTSQTISHIVTQIQKTEVKKVRVYPNPSNGRVYVVLPRKIERADLSICNVNGQEVMTTLILDADQISFDLEGDGGVYFIKVSYDDNSEVHRVIKL